MPDSFVPAALTPVDQTEKLKDLRVVRKRMLSLSQFLSRPIVVEITPVKVNRLREMRLA